MKKLLLITPAMLLSTLIFSQKIKEKEVPAGVKLGFEKLYPNLKDVDWEKEGSNFEAEFEQDENETSVVFDSNGHLLETETEIGVSSLPANIITYLKNNYPNQKIKEAAKMVTPAGTTTYETEIKGKDLIFDSNGNFLKEEKN